jgi:hypothetical protein
MNSLKVADMEHEMYDFACKGNAEAVDFLKRAVVLFHAGDDLIDERTEAEFKIGVLMAARELYGHPFFLKHSQALHAAIRTCVSTWADSVAWERSSDPDKVNWADHARHAGVDLIFVVADICGGWGHRRAVSREWRAYNLEVSQEEKRERGERQNHE